MAYGLYMISEPIGGHTIEVWARDWLGSSLTIAAMGATPAVLNLLGSDATIPETIVKSTLDLRFKVMDEDHQTYIERLYTSDATKFRVLLKEGAATVWTGYITPDSYLIGTEHRAEVSFTARENFGMWEQLDFDLTGMRSIGNVFAEAFVRIGWSVAIPQWEGDYISGTGQTFRQAVINCDYFTDKTWFEALGVILMGYQLRYIGDNEWRIINVGYMHEVMGSEVSPDFIYGAGTTEIIPCLRELKAKQEYGVIKEIFKYAQKQSVFGQYVQDGLYCSRFFPGGITSLHPSENVWVYNNYEYNNDEYPNPAAKAGDRWFDCILFPVGSYLKPFEKSIFVASESREITFKITAWNHGFIREVSEDGIPRLLLHKGMFLGLNFTLTVRFTVSFLGNGAMNRQYMTVNGGWTENKTDAEIIKSQLPQFKANSNHLLDKFEAQELSVLVSSVPGDGVLSFVIEQPEIGYHNVQLAPDMILFKNFSAEIKSDDVPGGLDLTAKVYDKANVQDSIDIQIGETPANGGGFNLYAGGVFGSAPYHQSLTGWHRPDNKGGNLHLTELVSRGYTHLFGSFTMPSGERTGGKLFKGTIKSWSSGLFRSKLAIGRERYTQNTISWDISAGQATVSARQSLPYEYQDITFEVAAVMANSKSPIATGGAKEVIVWSNEPGVAEVIKRRTYELSELSDAELDEAQLLADNKNFSEAKKVKGQTFARRTHAKQHFKGGADEIKPYDIDSAQRAGDHKQPFAAEDLTAQDLTARNATVAEDVRATNVYASKKLISPFVSSPEFLAAMLGYGFGGYVDENGESHVWADHLHGRQSFETLEMRYRKLLVSGEDLLVSSGGVVEEVLPFGQSYLSTPNGRLVITQDGRRIGWPSNGRVVFKLKGEPGIDIQQFDTDDILRYAWRDTETGNSGASGWLRVKKCFDTFWYEAEVVSGSPEWLRKGMSLGQMGNYTQKYRQGFINISARDKQIAIWDEVDSHILSPEMLKVYLGDLRYVTDLDFPMMQGYGLYSQSCYLKGVFVLKSGKRVDEEFDRVETEFQIIDGKIESKVSKTTYDENNTAIRTDLSSQIEQTAEAINLEVSKKVNGTEVISSINQTAEKIRIKSKLIELAGDTLIDDAFITKLIAVNAFIENLTVKHLSSRALNGQGQRTGQGLDLNSSFTMYDGDGNLTMTFDVGTDGMPKLTMQRGGAGVENGLIRMRHNEFQMSNTTSAGQGTNNLFLDPTGGFELAGIKPGGEYYQVKLTQRGLFMTENMSMPGILMGGAVRGTTGGKLGSWGPKLSSVRRLSQGVYEIAHSLNHINYFVTVTPRNPNRWNNGRAVVRSKSYTAFVVAMCDITSADSDIDCDFEFMVCGTN